MQRFQGGGGDFLVFFLFVLCFLCFFVLWGFCVFFSLHFFPPPPPKKKGSCFLEETFDVERNSALLRG